MAAVSAFEEEEKENNLALSEDSNKNSEENDLQKDLGFLSLEDNDSLGNNTEYREIGNFGSRDVNAYGNLNQNEQHCNENTEEETVGIGFLERTQKCEELACQVEEKEVSEQEIESEELHSPSSSGYAGGRGSSTPTSASGAEEKATFHENSNGIHQDRNENRHFEEDDASLSWRKQKRHFFVLSHSGKPIYSRYGSELELAAFSATLQAIISFVENSGDQIRLIQAGKHQICFVGKGPIHLVCICSTEEPFQALKGQLELLYNQILLILTKSIDRCFEKDSKFDMRSLLGGTDGVFSSLIHAFTWEPATYMHAYTCLPLQYATRQAATAILQDVADSGVLFAILMCKNKVISLFGAHKVTLHPDDMLLLSNFVLAYESFRTSESFSPVCLPHYNPTAFLYVYVHFMEEDTFLMLLTTDSQAFFHLKECRILIEKVLAKSNVLSEVKKSKQKGGLCIKDLPGDLELPSESVSFHLHEDESISVAGCSVQIGNRHARIAGPAGLWHFLYYSICLDQYVSSEFSPPITGHDAQKRLLRTYQKIFFFMHDKDIGPHKMHFRKDDDYVLLCWITQDFELYAVFDPLAERSSAVAVCNRICQWIRDMESELFILGGSSLSW